jgi:YesN/AraC family two-component response regulator
LQITTDICQRIIATKIYINENYSENIDLEQILKKAFLPRFHFHRLFTSIYREKLHQYFTQIRIKIAKEMLVKEGISITDVCNSIGF